MHLKLFEVLKTTISLLLNTNQYFNVWNKTIIYLFHFFFFHFLCSFVEFQHVYSVLICEIRHLCYFFFFLINIKKGLQIHDFILHSFPSDLHIFLLYTKSSGINC